MDRQVSIPILIRRSTENVGLKTYLGTLKCEEQIFLQSHGARSRSQAPFRHQTPCETSPSWDCLDRLNSLSPVFKIESVLIERRDAILICKQQFVDSRRDDVIDPQIRQVHTAITENTSIHLVVHSIFCNNLNLQLQLQLSEYSFFFTFHSKFMEPSDFLA